MPTLASAELAWMALSITSVNACLSAARSPTRMIGCLPLSKVSLAVLEGCAAALWHAVDQLVQGDGFLGHDGIAGEVSHLADEPGNVLTLSDMAMSSEARNRVLELLAEQLLVGGEGDEGVADFVGRRSALTLISRKLAASISSLRKDSAWVWSSTTSKAACDAWWNWPSDERQW